MGLAIFLIRVLPYLDGVRGLLAMNGVCIIPGLLNLFLRNRQGHGRQYILPLLLDVLAVIFQFVGQGALMIAPIVTKGASKHWKHATPFVLTWEIPVSMLFISVIWWENFGDKDIRIWRYRIPLLRYKQDLHRVRVKAYLIASLWKIGTLVGFIRAFLPPVEPLVQNVQILKRTSKELHAVVIGGIGEILRNVNTSDIGNPYMLSDTHIYYARENRSDYLPAQNNSQEQDYFAHSRVFTPFALQIVLSFLCVFFAKTACKLCMQKASFSVPLSLANPAAAMILLFACQFKSLSVWFCDFLYLRCMDCPDEQRWPCNLSFVAILLWFSQLWITAHVWTPVRERLLQSARYVRDIS